MGSCMTETSTSLRERVPKVRLATSSDAELIAKLTRECWVGKPENSSGHRETTEKVLQDLKTGAAMILEVKGQPVGSLRYWPVILPSTKLVEFHAPTVWEIGRIGILPAFRGQGLSTWLMNELTTQAVQRGIQEFRLAVRTDEPGLVKLYVRLGFRIDASLEYSHANENSPPPLVMRKYLFERPKSIGELL